MGVAVVVTSQLIESTVLPDWDAACGQAIREALGGAESVRLVDSNGAEYHVFAEPVEDNS
jgi:hypothetical protein